MPAAALQLKRKDVFTKTRLGLYKCKICPPTELKSLQGAMRHEELPFHIRALEVEDGDRSPSPSPWDPKDEDLPGLESDAEMQSPISEYRLFPQARSHPPLLSQTAFKSSLSAHPPQYIEQRSTVASTSRVLQGRSSAASGISISTHPYPTQQDARHPRSARTASGRIRAGYASINNSTAIQEERELYGQDYRRVEPQMHNSSLESLSFRRLPSQLAQSFTEATPALDDGVSQFVDAVANKFNLSATHRNQMHGFAMNGTLGMLIHQQAHAFHLEQLMEETQSAILACRTEVSEVKRLLQKEYKCTDGQLKLIKQLLRHYLVTSVGSNDQVTGKVQAYLTRKGGVVHLHGYPKDLLVREAVDSTIKSELSNVRSAFRKSVFEHAVPPGIPLDDYADVLVRDFHLGPPPPISDSWLARLALMRLVARPLAEKRGHDSTKGDTGFWNALNQQLAAFSRLNENERLAQENLWIEQDNEHFPTTTAEEFDKDDPVDSPYDMSSDENDPDESILLGLPSLSKKSFRFM